MFMIYSWCVRRNISSTSLALFEAWRIMHILTCLSQIRYYQMVEYNSNMPFQRYLELVSCHSRFSSLDEHEDPLGDIFDKHISVHGILGGKPTTTSPWQTNRKMDTLCPKRVKSYLHLITEGQ